MEQKGFGQIKEACSKDKEICSVKYGETNNQNMKKIEDSVEFIECPSYPYQAARKQTSEVK